MTAVPILQALSWGEESPLLRSGEVDIDVLARGLARAEFPVGRRPQPFTHAQHALVVSEAVDTLARLRLTERRVLAVHAWLAQIRNSELKDRQRAGSGKKNLALRTMDIEALADVLARSNRWNDPQSRSGGVARAMRLTPTLLESRITPVAIDTYAAPCRPHVRHPVGGVDLACLHQVIAEPLEEDILHKLPVGVALGYDILKEVACEVVNSHRRAPKLRVARWRRRREIVYSLQVRSCNVRCQFLSETS